MSSEVTEIPQVFGFVEERRCCDATDNIRYFDTHFEHRYPLNGVRRRDGRRMVAVSNEKVDQERTGIPPPKLTDRRAARVF
jgi:hypothetical protein